MLLAARLKDVGPSRRRGCTALCTSKDLKTWQVKPPFYAPNLYFTHECPDLFRIGDWWYLVFSEFSEKLITRYRMSRSLAGPWLTPPVDTFDDSYFYAAKTASDGKARYLFGWNATREGEQDFNPGQWGGNLAVHEIVQQTDGTLDVRLPENIRKHFATPLETTFVCGAGESLIKPGSIFLDAEGSFASAVAGELPDPCMVETTVSFNAATRDFGLLLRLAGEDREKIERLGRAAPSTLAVHKALLQHPIATAGFLAGHTGITPATVNKSLAHRVALGIVRELTQQKRNRIFSSARSIDIMNQGLDTAP